MRLIEVDYDPFEKERGKAFSKLYGKRINGTEKGVGFLGELKTPEGKIATEISIGVNIDGKEMQIPTLVPTLTKEEIDYLLAGNPPTKTIVQKAVEHAKKRLKEGKSPFFEETEKSPKSSKTKELKLVPVDYDPFKQKKQEGKITDFLKYYSLTNYLGKKPQPEISAEKGIPQYLIPFSKYLGIKPTYVKPGSFLAQLLSIPHAFFEAGVGAFESPYYILKGLGKILQLPSLEKAGEWGIRGLEPYRRHHELMRKQLYVPPTSPTARLAHAISEKVSEAMGSFASPTLPILAISPTTYGALGGLEATGAGAIPTQALTAGVSGAVAGKTFEAVRGLSPMQALLRGAGIGATPEVARGLITGKPEQIGKGIEEGLSLGIFSALSALKTPLAREIYRNKVKAGIPREEALQTASLVEETINSLDIDKAKSLPLKEKEIQKVEKVIKEISKQVEDLPEVIKGKRGYKTEKGAKIGLRLFAKENKLPKDMDLTQHYNLEKDETGNYIWRKITEKPMEEKPEIKPKEEIKPSVEETKEKIEEKPKEVKKFEKKEPITISLETAQKIDKDGIIFPHIVENALNGKPVEVARDLELYPDYPPLLVIRGMDFLFKGGNKELAKQEISAAETFDKERYQNSFKEIIDKAKTVLEISPKKEKIKEKPPTKELEKKAKPYEGVEPGSAEWMKIWKEHPELQKEMAEIRQKKIMEEGKKEEALPEAKTEKEPWEMTKKEFDKQYGFGHGGSLDLETAKKLKEEELPLSKLDEASLDGYLGTLDPNDPYKIRDIKKQIKKGKITVYRATIGNTINPGDFVTESLEYAKTHLEPGAKIIKKEVSLDELYPNASHEFFWIPKDIKTHKEIIEQALKEGKPIPDEVLKEYSDLAEKYKKQPPKEKPPVVPLTKKLYENSYPIELSKASEEFPKHRLGVDYVVKLVDKNTGKVTWASLSEKRARELFPRSFEEKGKEIPKAEAKAEKEPWRMTKEEFGKLSEQKRFKLKEKYLPNLKDIHMGSIAQHYEHIQQALKENKHVPEKVLKDYPDLTEKYKEAPKPETEWQPVKDYSKEITEGTYVKWRYRGREGEGIATGKIGKRKTGFVYHRVKTPEGKTKYMPWTSRAEYWIKAEKEVKEVKPLLKKGLTKPKEIKPTEPIKEVKGVKGKYYRSFENPEEAIGSDVSYQKDTPFLWEGAYEIEFEGGKGKEIPHHPGALRGDITNAKVTKVFYEPEYWAKEVREQRIKEDLAKLKKMFPEAEFIRVKTNPKDPNLPKIVISEKKPVKEAKAEVKPKKKKPKEKSVEQIIKERAKISPVVIESLEDAPQFIKDILLSDKEYETKYEELQKKAKPLSKENIDKYLSEADKKRYAAGYIPESETYKEKMEVAAMDVMDDTIKAILGVHPRQKQSYYPYPIKRITISPETLTNIARWMFKIPLSTKKAKKLIEDYNKEATEIEKFNEQLVGKKAEPTITEVKENLYEVRHPEKKTWYQIKENPETEQWRVIRFEPYETTHEGQKVTVNKATETKFFKTLEEAKEFAQKGIIEKKPEVKLYSGIPIDEIVKTVNETTKKVVDYIKQKKIEKIDKAEIEHTDRFLSFYAKQIPKVLTKLYEKEHLKTAHPETIYREALGELSTTMPDKVKKPIVDALDASREHDYKLSGYEIKVKEKLLGSYNAIYKNYGKRGIKRFFDLLSAEAHKRHAISEKQLKELPPEIQLAYKRTKEYLLNPLKEYMKFLEEKYPEGYKTEEMAKKALAEVAKKKQIENIESLYTLKQNKANLFYWEKKPDAEKIAKKKLPQIITKWNKEYQKVKELLKQAEKDYFYQPTVRTHEDIILVLKKPKKEGAKPTVVGAFEFPNERKAKRQYNRMLKGDYTAILNWFRRVGDLENGRDFVNNIKEGNYTLKLIKFKTEPTYTPEDIPLQSVMGILSKYKGKQIRAKNLQAKAIAEDIQRFIEKFVNPISVKSFHLEKKNIPGWSLDPIDRNDILLRRVLSEKSLIEKLKLSDVITNSFAQIDPEEHPQYYKWLSDFNKYMMTPREPETARRILSAWSMWGNAMSVIANATQTYILGPAIIIENKLNPAKFLKYEAEYLRKFIESDYDSKDLAYLEWGKKNGVFAPTAWKEGMLGLMGERKGIIPKIEDIGYAGFTFVESVKNRMNTFLAVAKMLEEKGMPFEEAMKKARDITFDIHFDMNKWNTLIRGKYPRLFQTLMSFTFHSFKTLRRLIFKSFPSAKERKYAIGALATFYLTHFLVGGMAATPGGELFWQMVDIPFKKVFGQSIKTYLMNEFSDKERRKLRLFIQYGLLGLAGLPSVADRIGFGYREVSKLNNFIADAMAHLAPIPVMIANQAVKAIRMTQKGYSWPTAISQQFSPTVVRNISRTLYAIKKGYLPTSYGKPLQDIYGNNFVPTGLEEIAMSFIGAIPPEQQEIYEIKEAQRKKEDIRLAHLHDITNDIVLGYLDKDYARIGRGFAKWTKYNKEIIKKIIKAKKEKRNDLARFWSTQLIEQKAVETSIRNRLGRHESAPNLLTMSWWKKGQKGYEEAVKVILLREYLRRLKQRLRR